MSATVVITVEADDLAVGARLDGVGQPTAVQAIALRDLAQLAGLYRGALLGEVDR